MDTGFRKNIQGFCSVAMLVALLPGCANMSDANRTRSEATVTGAAAGAVIGQLAGGNRDSAMAGAAIGALLGRIVGEKTARDKAQYAQNEDQLRTVIAQAEQMTQRAAQLNQKLANDIVALKRQRDELDAQQLSEHARQKANQSLHNRLAKMLANTNNSIAEVDRQLIQQRATLEQQRLAQATPKVADAELILVAEKKVSGLDQERAVLAASLEQLKQIDQRRVY